MSKVALTTRHAVLFLACAVAACSDGDPRNQPSWGATWDPEEGASRIDEVRARHGLPAVGVLVASHEDVQLLAVSGSRKQGAAEPALQTDRWHIGSNTKAMSATLIATFVRDGDIRFETTLADVFPELASRLSPDARRITVEHLLIHRSGLAPDPFETPEEFEMALGNKPDVVAQRRAVVERALAGPLLFEPGTDFAYSNTGFIVAAAVAERLGGEPWEDLLEQRVLSPLGITAFGFGAPGGAESLDQPWGHRDGGSELIPTAPDDPMHQNPPLFNPAGGVHISLSDWELFAREHVRGREGDGTLLSAELYTRLHRPPSDESGFAMGWGVLIEDGETTMLTHNGSDGNWFADIRIYPQTGIVFLLVTNDGREDDAAKPAFSEIRRALNERYEPFPR